MDYRCSVVELGSHCSVLGFFFSLWLVFDFLGRIATWTLAILNSALFVIT